MYWKEYSWSLFSILTMLVVLVPCVDAAERGFKSSNHDLMNELRTSLTREGIPFREDRDGFLMYQTQYEETVNRLRVEVEKTISGGAAVRWHDQESRDYLKNLLESKNMSYRVETRHDGEWIRWYPQSEEQKKEITMSVLKNQHRLNVQRQIAETRCNKVKPSSYKLLNKSAEREAGQAC